MVAKHKEIAVVQDGAVYVLQPGTPVYLKTPDVAAALGKSNQWIGQLVNQGTISKVKTAFGAMFEQRDTFSGYTRYMEEKAKEKDRTPEDVERLGFETSIKKAKAAIATMEASELVGKMHRSEDVAAMTEDLIYTLRGMLIALPGRLADDTFHAESSAEAEDVIRKEVYAVMEAISRYRYDPEKYAERVRERKNWQGGGEPDD